ncbi:active breakpoint cluster region-related protein-like isoform X1 [Salvelinus fontinalis]|uniref:active breakpoint cluster region-related protein-like isoform X1 n=1 Tax=Salvelinus fontinalis TaxID=8038 RepID=UPI0024854583|nr:active breakpoint cluster region-related protein-like isoform X1 [Salvelinus fontinalis]
MEVFMEAAAYLESQHIPVEAVGEPSPDPLQEDVFPEEDLFSPHQTDSMDLPDTPVLRTPGEMLDKRLMVLRTILDSEKLFLNELETLLMPMKALKATAGTSQPVLSSQQVQIVFYQVPELRDLHRDFYTGMRDRLGHLEPQAHPPTGSEQGEAKEQGQSGYQLMVGDLFLKILSQLGVYRGFIDNYESAVEIVRRCTQTDQRFRILAESMMSHNGSDRSKTKYTFEALLYKPLERITKTTLVLHDLLKHTPQQHSDHPVLHEVLRLSRSFLSGVNEGSQCKREVTLSRGMRRQLIRDGFVVDVCEGGRNLRHLFLYTDLLLCTKLKGGAQGKQAQYRFCWYLPLAGLKLHWGPEMERTTDTHHRIHATRAKMYLLRHELRQTMKLVPQKCLAARTIERSRWKKMEQLELMILTHSPLLPLELHSPSGKSHTLVMSSLYELEEWREAIHKLTGDNIEMVPPDLLTLTSSCVKLRMTQQPPLHSILPGEEQSLCGTLSVAVHSACGLQQPASVYVCVEVDGFEFYESQAQTHSSVSSLSPHWDQEFSFQVDGAQNLKVLCVLQPEEGESCEDRVLCKTSIQLDPGLLQKRWRRQTLSLGQVEVTMSLKYCPHPLDPPCLVPAQQQSIFCKPIGAVAQQEGVLVPHVVRCCVEEVERRGLEEVGIYRLSAATSDITNLKTAFNTSLREAVSRLRCVDVNAVSGILKLYFRELPEPLIPTELFQSFTKALDIPDLSSRSVTMLSLLQSCPSVNQNTFLFLLHHLKRVSDRQNVNKMPLMNLATVFGPSLLRPPVAILGQCSPTVDISQEVEVQVQVVYFYLQCDNLPEAQTCISHDTETTEEDETTNI